MKYLIGIDAGNTSSKVVVFDESGGIVSEASTPSMRTKRRAPGFEEFEVDELWDGSVVCIKEAIQKAKIDPKDIAGIGVTSFGNGCVFLGKNGEAIAPGAFSQDYRAQRIVENYKKEGVLDEINSITLGNLFAGEPGPILRWYKDNERDVYDKIGGVLLFNNVIMYRLTDVFATDLNNFGGSCMVDLNTMEYNNRLFELMGISELADKMPRLAEPSEIIGKVTAAAAAQTGLAEGTPVVAGMMDVLACLVGVGADEEGIVTAIGGSWCINETLSKIAPSGLHNMPYLRRGEYLNTSNTGASGSNYEWFTRVLGGTAKLEAQEKGVSYYKVLDELIGMVPVEKARVFFQPFVAQPSLHNNAKANFFNVDSNTSYAEICYSVAEGVAFIHKHHIDILKSKGLPIKKVRFTGGVARSPIWRQIFANVLEMPIESGECEETGALGVAIAAGIGAGIYSSFDDAFKRAVRLIEPSYPDESKFEIYRARYKEWKKLIDIMYQYWDGK